MPNEELRALQITREQLVAMLYATWSWKYFAKLALSKKMRHRLRGEISGCLRHYPFNCVIEQMWESRIKSSDEAIQQSSLSDDLQKETSRNAESSHALESHNA